MIRLLKSLQNTVGDVDTLRIDQLLADVAEDVTDTISVVPQSSDTQKPDEEKEDKATVSAEVRQYR